MKLIARFTIPGRPIPKARARVRMTQRGPYAYTPKKTADAEMLVCGYAVQAMQGYHTDGPVELYCRFFFTSNPRTEVEIWESDYTGTIPPGDADNMVKLVADSLAPFFNDRQIVSLTAEKVGRNA